MPDRQQLEQAIVVLEAQRPTLGNEVVELSLASLRRKLSLLQDQPQVAQYENVTVLVADFSGYTAMSELMDAEEVRDTINAIWEKLDGVIDAWGGRIDKHTGDGLIALFGLPTAHSDDRERAIMAALDMQLELALFNQLPNGINHARALTHTKLHMRIGIDMGPVVFGRVGMDGHETAMGDAVRMASQLQQLAPIGGTLISYDIYSRTHTRFEVEPLAPVKLAGKTSRLGVYVVKGERTSGIEAPAGKARSFNEYRLVGRHAELEQLQYALQMTIESGTAHFMTIVGEPGVGKSRLIYDFEQLLRLSPVRIGPFKGVAERQKGESPYALWRDLFRNRFGIHTPSSAAVAMEKLARGIKGAVTESSDGIVDSAVRIGWLLGLDADQNADPPKTDADAPGTQDLAFQAVVDFFRSVSTTSPATLIILDDVHWADEKSLDLIDYLLLSCQDIPLLIICSGRPALFNKRPSWQTLDTVYGSSYLFLELAPLSPIDSRHLIAGILRDSAPLPLNLVDLIIERTGGNPSYIEELTNMLVNSGVVFKEGNQWRAQYGKLQGRQMLPSLTNLLQARLDQLSQLEQETLKAAAVFGRIFWGSAVIKTIQSKGMLAAAEEIQEAIGSLERQELIYRHNMPGFAGVHEYVFRYNRLRNLAYQSIPKSDLAFYHAQAASWLIVNSESHLIEYASIIANHFEKASQMNLAAQWYGRAGAHAKDTYAAETAIQQYRRALSLLPAERGSSQQRIEFLEVLSELLRWRARFNETIDSYEEMKAIARETGDEPAEVRALLGLYRTYDFQGDRQSALKCSQVAEDVARNTGSPRLLAGAMAAKAWSMARLDEVEAALAIAREALTISTKAAALREIAISNALIGNICRIQHWYDQANKSTEKALALFRQEGDREWEGLMLGNLGHIAYANRDYAAAAAFYSASLRIANDLGEYYGILRCLRKLGRICQLENNIEQAIRHYHEAFVLAEKSRNTGYCAFIALDTGILHLTQAAADFHTITDFDQDVHLQQARAWLDRALNFGQDAQEPVTVASVKSAMARLLLLEERRDEAVFYAKEAFAELANMLQSAPEMRAREALGVNWRILGLIASELPDQDLPLKIGKKQVDAAACFNESLHSLAQIRNSDRVESAYSLFAWAKYELSEGDKTRGEALWLRARSLFAELGMEKHVAWMSQVKSQ